MRTDLLIINSIKNEFAVFSNRMVLQGLILWVVMEQNM